MFVKDLILGTGRDVSNMDKLFKMIEECARSDAKIEVIEHEFNWGRLTSGEAIDLIVEETNRVKQALQEIKKDQFILDRRQEAQNYE